MSRAKTETRVYRSVEELPEILEPGRYVVADHTIEVREPIPRAEIAYQLRVQKKLPKAPTI